ncbi:MAG: hypothetical protein QOD77_1493 [Thermoplasmata archaeon]|jgi:hypothetical protein|nr:hypothetical protein [Thermoplasmata archaeon]
MHGRAVLVILGLALALQVAATPMAPAPVVSGAPFGGELFGRGLALGNGTLLVSSICSATVAGCPGTVQAFTRSSSKWSWTQTLHAPVPAYGGLFGEQAVALDGFRAAVGESQAYRAHVLERDPASGVWSVAATLADPDPPAVPPGYGNYGVAIDLDGGTLAVGAWRSAQPDPLSPLLPAIEDAGAVHVYVRDPAGAWKPQARLGAADPQTGAGFGLALDLDGDRLLVGAPGTARAHLFERSGGAWSEVAVLAPGAGYGYAGEAVALDGDLAVVASEMADLAGAVAKGAASVWHHGAAGGWAKAADLVEPGGAGVRFGTAVALDGPCLAVGAMGRDFGTSSTTPGPDGHAYLYVLDASGANVTLARSYTTLGPEADHGFGRALAMADGLLAVGDQGMAAVEGHDNAGAAAVFSMPAPCGAGEPAPPPPAATGTGGTTSSSSSAPPSTAPPAADEGGPAARDEDRDGVQDDADNCPAIANGGQSDRDLDGLGDACDGDSGRFGAEPTDAGPRAATPPDRDLDGRPDTVDSCPLTADPEPTDLDGDGVGDACDPDLDGDGVANLGPAGAFLDRCPLVPDPGQEDGDGDGVGDACDPALGAGPALREAPPQGRAVPEPSSGVLPLVVAGAGGLLGSAGWLAWFARRR